MHLFEREDPLMQLTALYADAAQGRGACALVMGEAGIGKTALVRAFAATLPSADAVLSGACEALFTPRPLGPIVDMAGALPPGLAARIHEGHTYNGLFPALLGHLHERARPSVVVIEDVHWADESTLDWIKYAGRRVDRAPLLLVLTLRDDEVGVDHPLRRVMGELTAATTRRIRLAPLSPATIEILARQRGHDAALLARLTRGNPFYLTEMLAADGDAMPGSVRDAVLARFARLSDAARRVVEWVAIEPNRLERSLLDACVADADEAVLGAIDSGMLQADEHGLGFRHEIARQIIESALPPSLRMRLHAQLLLAMQSSPGPSASLARLVHHAHAAGLAEEVAVLAPRAAEAAARDGSHRDAAALYRLALVALERHEPTARAALLEAAANELQLTHALPEAIALREQALDLRRERGEAQRVGANLRLLGVLHAQLGNESEYQRYARAAVGQLEPLGPSGELAKAYASLSDVHYLQSEFDAAIAWGERAASLAEQVDDPAARVLALTRLGTARLCRADNAAARAQVEQALALAIECRFEGLAAYIFVSLQTLALNHHDHAYALEVGARGRAFCEARDLDGYVAGLRVRRAHSLLHLGRWDEGEGEYTACLALPNLAPQLRDGVCYALRRLAVRRGAREADHPVAARCDSAVDSYWQDAQARLDTLSIGFRLPAIAAACAEAAWLRCDPAAAIDAARRGLDETLRTRDGRLGGPLLVWLQRLGAPLPRFDGVLLPACALELAGDIAGAAQAWERLGNPYEQALALAFGNADQMQAALMLLESLGAQRSARLVRSKLHALGVRGLARGPLRRTRDDACGLTPRERQVFQLVTAGLSNDSIANRLHRSERTVEHHVSSVLAKLGVKTRVELIAVTARKMLEGRQAVVINAL